MGICKVEEIKKNGFVIEKRVQVPLIDNSMQKFILYPGEGYFSVGVKGIDKDNIKVWVNKDDIIKWEVLDECNIKSWPRFCSYTGNDTSFIKWSQTRKVEDFTWKPQKKMKADFSKSMIGNLYIYSDYELKLIFGDKIRHLVLYGDPNNFIFEKCNLVPSLYFYPKKDSTLKHYKLPRYECLEDAKEVLIKVDPNGAPFDCSSLLQFPKLELLHLIGNMTNIDCLKELKFLKKLGFWNVPDLSGIPSLDSWKNLNEFVAMNIDAENGKRLKKELSELQKEKKFEHVSITKLRNKLWLETEYGIPLSTWSEKHEKIVTRAYKTCLKKIKGAQSESNIKRAIVEFTKKINKLDNIETIDRDDIYNALSIIMKNSPIEIDQDKWTVWFDEVREF